MHVYLQDNKSAKVDKTNWQINISVDDIYV